MSTRPGGSVEPSCDCPSALLTGWRRPGMGLGDAWRRGESGVPRIEMGRRCAHPNPPMFPVQSRTLLQSDCERVTDRHTHSGCHVPVSGGSAKSICGTPKLYCSTNFSVDRKGDPKSRVSLRPGLAPCWKSCAQANVGRPVSRTVDLRGSRKWQGVQHLLNARPAGGLLGSGRGNCRNCHAKASCV